MARDQRIAVISRRLMKIRIRYSQEEKMKDRPPSGCNDQGRRPLNSRPDDGRVVKDAQGRRQQKAGKERHRP